MIDREYVEGLIDEGVKTLEKATEYMDSSNVSFDRKTALHIDIARGYAELAKVANSFLTKG